MDFGIQNNKGITLIALVVTIVILIILGGISISMLTGQNGILKKSQQAKEKTEISNELENVKLTTFSALTQNGTLIEKEEFQNILSQQKIDLEFFWSNMKLTINFKHKFCKKWLLIFFIDYNFLKTFSNLFP